MADALAQGHFHIGDAVRGQLFLQGYIDRGIIHLAVGAVQAGLQGINLILGIGNLAFQGQQVAQVGRVGDQDLQPGHQGLLGFQPGLGVVIAFGHVISAFLPSGHAACAARALQKGIQLRGGNPQRQAGGAPRGARAFRGVSHPTAGCFAQAAQGCQAVVKGRGGNAQAGGADDLLLLDCRVAVFGGQGRLAGIGRVQAACIRCVGIAALHGVACAGGAVVIPAVIGGCFRGGCLRGGIQCVPGEQRAA